MTHLPKQSNKNRDTPEPLQPLPANREGCTPANKIPDETRSAIIDEFISCGNISATARKFGVSRGTVAAIIKEIYGDVKELIDIEFAGRIENITRLALERLADNIDRISPQQLGTIIGILIDKRQMLTGKARSNDNFNLKIAWKDGSGAIEVTTGPKK